MDKQLEKILDEEYEAELEKLRFSEWILDDDTYENIRANWIMRKIELWLISLL